MQSEPIHTNDHANSYYKATANNNTTYPQLKGQKKTDICIIGAGFTGVNTALELAKKGFKVIVIESRKVGWGASGRNGGQLIRGIGHDPKQFLSQIGQQGVNALEKLSYESVDLVRQRIKEEQISCDLTMGYLDVALNKKQYIELEEDFIHLNQSLYPHKNKLINKDALFKYIHSDRYVGGLFDAGSGHLHPLNLLLGEVEAAKKMGVIFYENTSATKIDRHPNTKVHTDLGFIHCQFVVIACNAYLNDLEPSIARKILPAGSYIITTEPLSSTQIILPKNTAVSDMSVALDYYRLSVDRRLIFGGLCHYSGKNPTNIVKAMHPKMLKVFPQLVNTKIEYSWGGYLGIGFNRMPQIGRIHNNIYYSQAYAGHGINVTHIAGKILADVINTQTETFDIFSKIKHKNFIGGKKLRPYFLALGMLWYRFKELV